MYRWIGGRTRDRLAIASSEAREHLVTLAIRCTIKLAILSSTVGVPMTSHQPLQSTEREGTHQT
jgi:hypothetical protein